LVLLRINRGNVIDLREVTVGFVKVNAVTHNKDIIDRFPKIVGLDLYFPPRLFIQESADLYGARIREGEPVPQELERSAAIDDILNNEEILSFHGSFNIFGDLNNAGGLRAGSVTGQPDEIDLDRNLKIPYQVGQKHEGPFQNTHQDEFSSSVVFRNLVRQTLDDGSDLIARDQKIKTIFLHDSPCQKTVTFSRPNVSSNPNGKKK
jgi:hypothetical protein